MEVWLVRHTSVDVPAGTCYGRSDVPLRTTFDEEAAAVRKTLADTRFDAVWCSPLSRCVRLAEACGYPDAQRDARLLELNFGAWEMRRFDEIDDPQLQHWFDDWLHVRPTGGESFADQIVRVGGFLDELRRRPIGRALLFVHGGVQLCAGVYAGLFPPEEAFSHQLPYGSILKITI